MKRRGAPGWLLAVIVVSVLTSATLIALGQSPAGLIVPCVALVGWIATWLART